MKKEYIKPYLAVESFQLNAAIAGACTGKITLNQSVDECTTHDGNGMVNTSVFLFGAACIQIPNGIDITQQDTCYQAMSMSDQFLTS